MIKKVLYDICILVTIVTLAPWGCENKTKSIFPAITPEQVVIRFFNLLAEGGKLTTKEAHQMIVNSDYLDQNTFRRWTDSFSNETKLKILNTKIADMPNTDGDYVATVKLELQTPSIFDDKFISTSQINLILDKTDNEWKIDFLAQTIDEESFRKAPVEAKTVEPTEKQK